MTLSPEQERELHDVICGTFNQNELEQNLRYHCDGVVLERIVPTKNGFDQVVFDLIRFFGHAGKIDRLLDTVQKARPDHKTVQEAVERLRTEAAAAPLERVQESDTVLRDSFHDLLFARSSKDLSRILYDLDAYLETHRNSTDGRLLRDTVRNALRQAELQEQKIPWQRPSPRPNAPAPRRVGVLLFWLLLLGVLVAAVIYFRDSLGLGRRKIESLGWRMVTLALVPAADQEKFNGINRMDTTGASFLPDPIEKAVALERNKNGYKTPTDNHYFSFVTREWSSDEPQPKRITLKKGLRSVVTAYGQGFQRGRWVNEWHGTSRVGSNTLDLSGWKLAGERGFLVFIVFPLDQDFFREWKAHRHLEDLLEVSY